MEAESDLFSHFHSAEVDVGSGPVPVTRHGFGVQGGHDAKVLGNTMQEVPAEETAEGKRREEERRERRGRGERGE